MFNKVTILVAVCAALVLLPSVSATSATSPTQSMPFQSWSCVTNLDDHPAPRSVMVPVSPVSSPPNEGPNRASKFLYNLVWGPPNTFSQLSVAGLNNLVPIATLPTFANAQWSANITSSVANGFPTGCCNMTFGTLTVFELGCKFCINNGASALPTISTLSSDYTIKTTQAVLCQNVGVAGVQCSQPAYVPGFKTDIWSGFPNTGLVTQGTGVSTLMFPSNANAVLAGGIYTFQLWAESLCGVAKSKDVVLAARCPPSPVVSAVVRAYAGGSITTPSMTLDWPYQVSTGNAVVIDASCSYPYLIQKPNWPSGQGGFNYTGNGPSPDASATAFNGARNLYAIQTIYFNAGDAQTMIMNGGVASSSTSVQATSAYFTASPMQDYWAALAYFTTKGAHTVYITVTDGCSAGQAYVTVNAQCTCTPVAKAAFVPTIWSNSPTGPANNMFNSAINDQTAANQFSQGPVGVNGVLGTPAYAQYGFTLAATGFDFEETFQTNLAYDWSFVSWAPDFSQTSFSANGAGQTLAQMHLTGPFPPSASTACVSALSGRPPIQCATGNNFGWGLTAAQCCFSTADIITDVGTFQRPTVKGTYKYAVMRMTSVPGTIRSWTNSIANPTRAVVYDFMRIGTGCNSQPPLNNDVWNTTVSVSQSGWGVDQYVMLPMYLDFTVGLPWSSNTVPQSFADFNGFPFVNGQAGSLQNNFLPTTECGGWLKIAQNVFTYTQTQVKFNTTITCGANADLVICRVTIIQQAANAQSPWNQPNAALSVSSFGSCRGSWTFQLAVDDSCNTATDIFTVKVGCNRAPIVSAGCTNSQTWTRNAGIQNFQQISLDGRATFDPDNFGDSFNGLSANNGGVFPACLSGGPACVNGGLGLRGLTYAWALISFTDASGVNQYNTTSRQNCPTNANNIKAKCEQTYCAGAFVYPYVQLYTQMYDPTQFLQGTTGTNDFVVSIQGTSTLIQAWGTGFFAVNSQLTSAPNTLSTYNAGGTTMTMQRIFPDFEPSCAPTVFPMFVANFATTGSSLYTNGATAASWDYAQQLAHTGNSAYMSGLTKAGTYRVRLYAFDGCSVGMGDVVFVTECPSMTFSSVATTSFWNINSTVITYNSGDTAYGYTPPYIQVNYGGTNDIAVTVTVTVWRQITANPPTYTPTGVTCPYTQDTPVQSGFRIMVPGAACSTFFSALSPATYVLQATADDSCVRGAAVTSVISNPFAIACPAGIVLGVSGSGVQPSGRVLTFTPPAGAGQPGTFGNLALNITARATMPNNGVLDYFTGSVELSYSVFWKPTNPLAAPAADGNGMGQSSGNIRSAFFQATGQPQPGTFRVFTSSNFTQPYSQSPFVINGGARTIQFPSNTAATLTNTQTTGLIYNTATDAGQVSFVSSVGNGILWAGDYYIGFTGDARNSGNTASLGCGFSFQPLDQFFQVTCPAIADPTANVVGTNAWSGTAAPYFGACPWSSTSFRSVTLSGSTAGQFYQGVGDSSGVSYMLSYRLPFTMAPNATEDNAPTIPTVPVNFITVYQNPLLIQPLGTASAGWQTAARYGNAWNQVVTLTMPGTWRINTFATNGCANVTGAATGIDLQAYCYDSTLPQAILKLQVRANVQGCTTPVANDASFGNYCDMTTLQVLTCTTVRAVRGPLLKGTNGFFRRRLLSEEQEQEQVQHAGRRLLQTSRLTLAAGTTLCTENNGLAAPSPPQAFTSPVGGTVSTGYTYSAGVGSYMVATTAVLSPNWHAFATVYFNSFDISPSYTPSYDPNNNGDLRNFYGMGDLFGDGKLAFGFGGNNVKIGFQGAFDGLTIQVDTSARLGTGRVFSPGNNANYVWYNLNSWSSAYTVGAAGGGTLPWLTTTSPNAAYSSQCSWQPSATPLQPTSATAAYTGQSSINMALVGCSPIGNLGGPSFTSTFANAADIYTAGVFQGSTLVVTARAKSVAPLNRPSTVLGEPRANPLIPARVKTLEGNYDYQVLVWNGPVGASCYDYRAVRVRAVCNRLVPGVSGGRANAAIEGPLMYGASASATPPASWSTVTSATTTVPSTWNLGAFDTVNLMGLFQYLQCGAGPAMPTGTAPDDCGSLYGSFNGEGNYFSLQVRWSVTSAPTGSMFDVGVSGIRNGSASAIVQGNTVPQGAPFSVVDPQDSSRTINYQYYQRVSTWTMPQYRQSIVLLNHGYKYPTTSFRPDIVGSYSIQLSLDDGCSSWTGASVQITAACADFTTMVQGLFSSIVQVNVVGSATAVAAGTAIGAVSQYAVSMDGSTYQRITMSVDPQVPAGYYFTYKWTVTRLANSGGAATVVGTTNMQGNVASFIPEPSDAVVNVNTFSVQLEIRTNCMLSANTPQSLVFNAAIVVSCTLSVTQDNFRFFTPYVSSWASTSVLPTYWGVPPAGAPNFISAYNDVNSATNQFYYAENRVLGNMGVTSQVTNPINCDPTGPYCGPYGTGSQTVPTILFGGSVPPRPAGFTLTSGMAFDWAVTNGVTGAHFQRLYFSVPATLTNNLCKIKNTYWVLSGYQNALPFVPEFVPSKTVNNITLCTPQQTWSWTVTSTPCMTCAASLDVCDLDPYYQYQTVLKNNQLNSGYTPPAFYTINQANPASNGQVINGFCVYDGNNRLSGLPNNANLVMNCAVSGRGLSVIVSQTGASQNLGAQGTAYPMDQIAFVPSFPGAYTLDLNVFDGCGPAVTATVTINAMCRKTPTITQLKTTTNAYYYCSDNSVGQGRFGVPNTSGVGGIAPGKFEPVYLNTIVAANGISNTDATVAAPTQRKCQVNQVVSRWNCTDVKNYVNLQDVAVDTSETVGGANKFKACCTCLYGSQVINVNSGTAGRSAYAAASVPASASNSFAANTQQNILALSDAEYNKNYIFLIAIVTPLAVLLVASLAGNVLMLLKVRSAVTAPSSRDVELSTSPRARVDV